MSVLLQQYPHKAHSRSAHQAASWRSGHRSGAGCICFVKEACGAAALQSVIIPDMRLPETTNIAADNKHLSIAAADF